MSVEFLTLLGTRPAEAACKAKGDVRYGSKIPLPLFLVPLLLRGHEGYVVARASGGTAALKLLETHAPACILLDTKMDYHPDGILDGHWFLQQLKECGRWYPIIGMAATPSFLEESVRQGCAAVIVKPFEMDELLETIKQVVASGEQRNGQEH